MKGRKLRMKEKYKYDIVDDYINGRISEAAALVKLERSKKSLNRYIKQYETQGKESFIHGNRGRKPSNTIDDETALIIIALYVNKYYDSNFVHYKELLQTHEGINVSVQTIRNIFIAEDILSPCATRIKKSEWRKRQKQFGYYNDKESNLELEVSRALELELTHPSRPRKKYFGELIQMDASDHQWWAGMKTQLHAAIDDATGKIVGAYFDKQETLHGYYKVTEQILNNYGIPNEIITDRRTVFEYKLKKESSLEKDTFTQYAYTCKILGTKLTTSSIPQAKGRIERLFRTLQSRLIIELRIRNITNIEDANEFLNKEFINAFNEKFGIHLNDNMNCFIDVINKDEIPFTLSTKTPRKILSGNVIRYKNKRYYPRTGKERIAFEAKTSCLVISSLDNKLYCTVGDVIYDMIELLDHERYSKEIDLYKFKELDIEPKPKIKYVPPNTHPWKLASFKKFVEKEKLKTLNEIDKLFG